MAIIVNCPCGKRLSAPDSAAGKRVRCPGCQKVLVVPAPDPPPDERMSALLDGVEAQQATRCPSCNEPLAPEAVLCVHCGYDLRTGEHVGQTAPPQRKSKRKKGTKKAWRTVRLGLTLVYVALLTYIGVFLGLILAAVAALTGAPPGLLAMGLFLGIAALFGGAILQLVGQCLCLAAPPSQGARGFIIAAIACIVGSLLLGVIDGVQRGAAGPMQQQGATTALSALGFLLGLAGNVLFLLFLRAVALSFRFRELASDVIRYLVLLCGFPFFVIASAILLPIIAATMQGGMLRNVVALIWFVVFLVYVVAVIVWYIRLIRQTRDAIPH